MRHIKKILRYVAYGILTILVSLSLYTFIATDILKKDYVNVFGYTYFVVSTGSMSGAIEVNDIIIVKITDNVKVKDIITYKNSDGSIITHRLVSKVGNKYIAQGDVNNVSDEPILKKDIIGKVSLVVSPSFILKFLAVFLILFIFLSLINFDKIVKKYVVNDNKNEDDAKKKEANVVPDNIFKKRNTKEEKHSGLTVSIPLAAIEDMSKKQEEDSKVEVLDDTIELLDVEDVIDVESNSIVTLENNSKESEKELLEQVVNLLRIKNPSLTTAKINKKWLTKYQYVFKLSNILLLGDITSLNDEVNHPGFREIYDYDLEKAGLYENLRNKIYDMPIYVFLRILAYAVLYNDEEFFDGVYKIMKYKIQIDKNGYFAQLNDSYSKKQVKLLISFMKKISLKFDNKNVFELERIERLAKLKNYANN